MAPRFPNWLKRLTGFSTEDDEDESSGTALPAAVRRHGAAGDLEDARAATDIMIDAPDIAEKFAKTQELAAEVMSDDYAHTWGVGGQSPAAHAPSSVSQAQEQTRRMMSEYGPKGTETLEQDQHPNANLPERPLPEKPVRSISEYGPGGTEPPEQDRHPNANLPPKPLPLVGQGGNQAVDGGNATELSEQSLHPDARWTNEVTDSFDKWPKADTAPDCEYSDDGRVIVRWLVRADMLLRKGSNKKTKLSQFFKVKLPGGQEPHPQFKLQLMATSQGTHRGGSGFGESKGHGKVQILSDCELPPHLRNLRVRIATGRGDRAGPWRGPKVATMKDPKQVFELQDVEWNFRDAQETEGHQPLPIIVELSLASG